MKKAKRNVRSYKVADKYYNRAQRKFAKTDKTLAERIEEFVIDAAMPEKKIGSAIDLPSDYISWDKVGALRQDGTVEPIYGTAINSSNKKKK